MVSPAHTVERLLVSMVTATKMDDETIYRTYAQEITAFATSMVGRADAPDVVSTAVLSALSSPGWIDVANPRAYLYRSVYHEAIRHTKRRTARSIRERRVAERTVFELPALRPDVAQAVRTLSPQQRGVIVLTYWHDMAVADVAEHLGISDGAVRRHLARARANLRTVLDD